MIQIEKVHIEEFRGIRSLDLDLHSRNFVVYGPNGSGKSGVVDAIEFGLTGTISRLTGSGTGGVSVAQHAPHVLRCREPHKARVELAVRDVATGDIAVLTRSVKNPGQYRLSPDTTSMHNALRDAMNRPELTLSRRELLQFVVTRPGDRAAAVQTLLKLETVGAIRRSLKATQSKARSEAQLADAGRGTSERSLAQHLQLAALDTRDILAAVNGHRAALGLVPLDEVTVDTDVLQGIEPRSSASPLNIETARRDVATLRNALVHDDPIENAYKGLREELDSYEADPSAQDAIRHRALLDAGLGALDGPTCPLCGISWETQEMLEAHLRDRIAATEAAQAARQRVTTSAKAYQTQVRSLREAAEAVTEPARVHGGGEVLHELRVWITALARLEGQLSTFESVTAEDAPHTADAHAAPCSVSTGLSALADTLDELPDESAADAARSALVVTKERLGDLRAAQDRARRMAAVKAAADAVYDAYCAAADEALITLYRTVEADFSRYYQFVNADDEGTFRAVLTPAAGSLDLTVDFYGLGQYPPVAYHSEGHQDGMGVVLYLALVKQLLGQDLRFAVLDDVVTSVDAGHRRRFAELLRTEFPDTQFIVTTHDEVWARQMRAAGLVSTKGMARFYGWTVSAGPTYGYQDTWQTIEADLAKQDIPGAGHKLRRTLEASTADIAERIRAKVRYTADANYDLSELLDAVKGRHGELLRTAALAAQSWGDQQQVNHIATLKERRTRVLREESSEEWLINKVVHNNDWANATAADFRPVFEAVQEFLTLFRCDNVDCGSWIWVSGMPGREDAVRCQCGSLSLNLLKKPG